MEFYLFNEDYYLEKGAFKLDFIISALELFHHGGWVMYPLLACSIFSCCYWH